MAAGCYDSEKIHSLIKNDDFEACLQLALSDTKLLSSGFELKESQRNLLLYFLNGFDSIGVLPTNYGKSIIYQLAPTLAKYLLEAGYEQFPKNPLVIIVSPINALVDDQVKRCKDLNVRAVKLCAENIGLIKDGKFDIFYTSPEWILSPSFREVVLLDQRLRSKVIGIVIDEAHVVVKWGTSSNPEKSAFRSMYSQVGKLRAFFNKPFLCLTATANKSTRQHLVKLLLLRNTKIEKLSPEKTNVKLSVTKVKSIDEFLSFLNSEIVSKIRETGKCPKSIIYCSSIKNCGEIYISLKSLLNGFEFPVAMFYSKTPDNIKNDFLDDFVKENSKKYCIVVATCALGLGVNIPNIRCIFHFGLSSDIESYVQEIGRAGRDNDLSDAKSFFLPQHLMNCVDEDLVTYVKNEANLCRRQLLLSFFKEKGSSMSTPHRCCDVCDSFCNCGTCKTIADKDKKEQVLPWKRKVSGGQIKVFKACLLSRNETFQNSGVFNVDAAFTLSNGAVSKLVEALPSLYNEDQLVNDFALPDSVAYDVLKIIKEIFPDTLDIIIPDLDSIDIGNELPSDEDHDIDFVNS